MNNLKKFFVFFLILMLEFLNLLPVFAKQDDIILQKDEQIKYTIVYKDTFYPFLIKKYSLINNSNNEYKIIKESELYNTEDYNTLLSLKKNAVSMSDDTFFYVMCSMFFPPLLVAGIPMLIKDNVKAPVKAYKNRKEKKEQVKYKQSLTGAIIQPGTTKIFFTLQNLDKTILPYEITLQNIQTNFIIEIVLKDGLLFQENTY